MERNDMLWRGTAYDGQFRILAVESTQTAQTARDLHDLSPINALLMGKMISAAAMLSLDLKAENSEVTLRIEGNGKLRGAMVICTQGGDIRGYTYEPHLYFEQAEENFHPVKHLGTGTLSVIHNIPDKKPTLGFTALEEGEVAQNLARYYETSEQIPTAVNLGVLIDKNAKIRASGGFIIQQLPMAQPLYADRIRENLARTPNVSDLMDMGLSLPDILSRYVFPDPEPELHEAHPVCYHCNCSRERFERALKLLGRDELKEMLDGIDPECHFCNKSYHFSGGDIARIISSLKVQK